MKWLRSRLPGELWLACILAADISRESSMPVSHLLNAYSITKKTCCDMLMQAIAAALADGAVPELIYLDMRGNAMTEACTGSLVSSCCCIMSC